ncbi:MAG: non-homologous end-joining DNA ligase [Actinobacteria bacterium]|nr:non-homologous end-joining DNA ligase [Actinomycetota bacterium]
MSERQVVEIGGRELSLSNLDKVLYPDAGFTKAHVIDYYARIAPLLLTHLHGRPLTMKRYPDGVDGETFFEKRCPSHAPEWIETITMPGARKGKDVEHCTIDDESGLAWVSNLASLELHTSLARRPDVHTPTSVVFDLDPGEGASIVECAEIALILRDAFARMELEAFPKTSGKKGLQVYLPLNTPTSYEDTRGFALAVAELLERVHPDKVTSNMRKDLRTRKVLIDWSQNHLHKTTVCVYSLRATATPRVSTPVTWDEITAVDEPTALGFEATDVLDRVDALGDLFADVETVEQRLPQLGS